MQVKGIESLLALLYGTGVLLAESIARAQVDVQDEQSSAAGGGVVPAPGPEPLGNLVGCGGRQMQCRLGCDGLAEGLVLGVEVGLCLGALVSCSSYS